MTKRFRAWRSPVVLYWRQRASAAWGVILLVVGVAVVVMTWGGSWREGGTCCCWYRPQVQTPTSPIRGNRDSSRARRVRLPRPDASCRRRRAPTLAGHGRAAAPRHRGEGCLGLRTERGVRHTPPAAAGACFRPPRTGTVHAKHAPVVGPPEERTQMAPSPFRRRK